MRVLARPKYWLYSDQTDQEMGVGQIEETEICVLIRPLTPEYGYKPDQNVAVNKTKNGL